MINTEKEHQKNLPHDKEYEIIQNKEDFIKNKKHKFKKAWYNKKNKLCLECFILLGEDKNKTDYFNYIRVIKGEASKDKKDQLSMSYNDLFNGKTLVFLGYLDQLPMKEKLDEHIKLEAQGLKEWN